MKVLMFGWEFPPHISGGLGTACAGLTRALAREQVEILFIIPKLHGGEQADKTVFISASEIPIRQIAPASAGTMSTSPVHAVKIPKGSPAQAMSAEPESRTTLIEVPSFLSAYAVPGESPAGLEQWSYSFRESTERLSEVGAPSTPASSGSPAAHAAVKRSYAFSGTYGKDLLDEVERYARVAEEICARYSFDVIHAHDWMTFPAGLAAKRVSGKPLVAHVHATEVDRSGEHVNKRVFAIEKEGMMSADKVVTVSSWTRDIAVRHYGVDESRVEVVHNGIAPKTSTSVAAGLHFDAPMVTFLGRITHQKGPMYFVEAARRVHASFPDAHFVVAGSGDQLPAMIRRIAQLKLSEYFHFTGFLNGEDIDRIWAMSRVYVMPSVSEPFGIAPLEAIQAGVPVIVSRQTGVSEVMRHAIKVDFWDCDALAEAICNILRYKSLANTLRKNGMEEIKSITWDKAAKKITDLYYELSTKPHKHTKSRLLLSGAPAPPPAETAIL